MDGFEEDEFFNTEAHFQFGEVVVEFGGVLVDECNNPDYFHPIAKATSTEGQVILECLRIFDNLQFLTCLRV